MATVAVQEVAKPTVKKQTDTRRESVDTITQKYDTNGDGVFDKEEVQNIVRDVMDANKQKGMYRNALGVSVFVILALIGAMLAVSIAAGEMVKESHVKGDGMMMGTSGSVVKVDIAESNHALFDLPRKSIEELAKLKRMDLFVDTTGNAALGNTVTEATYALSSAILVANAKVIFTSTGGDKITVDGDAKTCSVVIDGASYPCGDGTGDVKPLPAVTAGRSMFSRRASFLTTQGSFTLSSGNGNLHGTSGR